MTEPTVRIRKEYTSLVKIGERGIVVYGNNALYWTENAYGTCSRERSEFGVENRESDPNWSLVH